MTNELKPSMRERSSLVRFFRWFFSWRIVRRTVVALSWTIVLVGLLYREENWRGHRDWQKYRQQLEATGTKLNFQDFIPKPVPDEQNFAATPFFDSLFAGKGNHTEWRDDFDLAVGKVPKPKGTDRGCRQLTDLAGWEMAFARIKSGNTKESRSLPPGKLDGVTRAQAAPAILEALKPNEPFFAELRAVSGRSQGRYPIRYTLDDPWGILLPHLGPIRKLAARLQLKASAELALTQSEGAEKDIKLILRLADSLHGEATVVSYLGRLGCVNLGVQAIWEGLSEHRWSDAQLLEFQKHLGAYNFLAELSVPLGSERAAGILTADLLYRQKYHLDELLDINPEGIFSSSLSGLVARVAPRGWYYQEQLNYCRLYMQLLDGTYDPTSKRVFPNRIAEHQQVLEDEIAVDTKHRNFRALWNHRLLAVLMLPSLTRILNKSAAAQTATDHASIACALERYRMANGEFPETLEALMPKFISGLPPDVISGGPFKYRREAKNGFTLYGVGWNERDEGGQPGTSLFSLTDGDWLWDCQPK